MAPMSRVDRVVADMRIECAEDYVGLWRVYTFLRDGVGGTPGTKDKVLEVAERLLADPQMHIGQFEGERFIYWEGSSITKLRRLDDELMRLNREPILGEIAWFVAE